MKKESTGKKFKNGTYRVYLCLCLLLVLGCLLAGCGRGTEETTGDGSGTESEDEGGAGGLFGLGKGDGKGGLFGLGSGSGGAATGGWTETDLTPEGAGYFRNTPFLLENGTIELYATDEGRLGNLVKYVSTDLGKSFTQEALDWEKTVGGEVTNIAGYPNGTYFLTTYKPKEGDPAVQSDGTVDWEAVRDVALSYWLQPADGSALRQIHALDEKELSNIVFLDEKTLFLEETDMTGRGKERYVLFDLAAEKELLEITDLSRAKADFFAGYARGRSGSKIYFQYLKDGQDNYLGAFDANGKAEWDLAKLSASDYSGCADGDGNYYFTGDGNIYRVADGGSLVEQIMDDDGFDLGLSSFYCNGICYVKDRCFFCVLIDNSDFSNSRLVKYEWDDSLVRDDGAKGSGSLKIWSLEKNNTVKAAVARCKKDMKGVKVEYVTGLEEGDGKQKEEAIKALYASLTAKDAPDIIILDGLDYLNFKEKGLLADISGADGLDAVLPNITAGFTDVDGKLYAIPARFRVPVLFSEKGELDSVNSLSGMTQAVTNLAPRPNYDGSQDEYYAAWSREQQYALGFIDYNQLLQYVMETGGQALIDGNRINEEKLREAVTFAAAVAGHYGMNSYPEKGSMNGVSMAGDGIDVVNMNDGTYEYNVTAHARYGWEIMETPAFFSQGQRSMTKDKSADVDFQVRRGLTEHPFLPSGLAGVRAGSGNMENAKRFLGVLLGEAVQDVNQEDGCPVRVSSLQKSIDKNAKYVRERGNYHGDMMAFYESVSDPVIESQSLDYLKEYILEHVKKIAAGSEDVDGAVRGIMADMELRLREQE